MTGVISNNRKPGIAARVLRIGCSKGIADGELSLKSGPGLHRDNRYIITIIVFRFSRPRTVIIITKRSG